MKVRWGMSVSGVVRLTLLAVVAVIGLRLFVPYCHAYIQWQNASTVEDARSWARFDAAKQHR